MPNGTFSEQDREDWAHLKKDVWYGNGRPGLTTRMQQAEDCMEAHEARMELADKKLESINMKFWAIVVLLIAACIAASVDAWKGHDQPAQVQQHSFNY